MLQLSLITLGDLADEACLIIYNATYFGVTSSDNPSRISLILLVCLTSPILSLKKGMMTHTDLLLTLSQVYWMTVNSAMASLMILMLLSFQSFILALTNLTTASITSPPGFSEVSYSPTALKPSTLSCHLASSNLAATSDPKTSLTLASASSLLNPEPTSSS